MNQKSNIIFISHGGGPMPLLGDPDHKEMLATLEALRHKLDKPSAILLISAHWEASKPTLTSGSNPSLIYDYSGFPPESYDIQYPCQGQPELADAVSQVLREAGIESEQDDARGFDHGLFVPLKLMYPQADIPCVQLSLVRSLSPEAHLAIGEALKALEWDNLLVIGSGFSFHNMRAFFSEQTGEDDQKNQDFQIWLRDTLSDTDLSHDERSRRLTYWQDAPAARFCHPREEHLLPLHVCYGMAQRQIQESYEAMILKKLSLMFHWQV